jgi:hypothetical protein
MREAGVSPTAWASSRGDAGKAPAPGRAAGVRGIVMMLLARPAALLHWLA